MLLVICKRVEVLVKISQSELERQRHLERQRAERDAASLAADARVAYQKGFETGILVGHIQVSQMFLGQPETPRQELARLDREDLEDLEYSLMQQVNAKMQAPETPPTREQG